MKATRRLVLGALAVLPAGAAFGADAEADWPVRPVRIVSPYTAGGANDISARILAEHIGQSLKQQFVIENKAGAGTRIANETVARAEPDGYTFLYAAAPYATAEALYGTLRYERRQLAPVCPGRAALSPQPYHP